MSHSAVVPMRLRFGNIAVTCSVERNKLNKTTKAKLSKPRSSEAANKTQEPEGPPEKVWLSLWEFIGATGNRAYRAMMKAEEWDSSLSGLTTRELRTIAATVGVDPAEYLNGTRTGRKNLEHAVQHRTEVVDALQRGEDLPLWALESYRDLLQSCLEKAKTTKVRTMVSRQYRAMRRMLASLTPAERTLLEDPNFITENEADLIWHRRDLAEPAGELISLDELFAEMGIARRPRRKGRKRRPVPAVMIG
jgi:hypothetical protein